MNNAVENGIGKSGGADDFMPVLDRHLSQGAPIELSKSVSDGERCGELVFLGSEKLGNVNQLPNRMDAASMGV